jgi:hypothetical protein
VSATQLTIFLTALSVIATFVASYAFYRLSTRDRKPVYMKTGSRVVSDGDGIEVLFHGAAVPRVTRTMVFFWNAGRESIRSEDVREPVTLEIEGGSLLSATILRSTRVEIRTVLDIVDDAATLTFSHLDRGDGCCIEVMHTAPDPMGVTLSTVVVGVKTGPTFLPSPFWDDPAGVWIPAVTSVGGVVFLIGSAIGGSWLGAFGGAAATILGLRLAWSSRRRDRRYVPREFWDLQIPQNPNAAGGVTGWRLRA